MRRTKRKFFCVADLTSAIGDGPIGIKADSHKQRASSTAVLGGLERHFWGRFSALSQEDTKQAVISVEAYSKVENDKSAQGK